MIARYLGVRVWELDTVAIHYQEEAAFILEAQYNAKIWTAKQAKCTPEKVILPEY